MYELVERLPGHESRNHRITREEILGTHVEYGEYVAYLLVRTSRVEDRRDKIKWRLQLKWWVDPQGGRYLYIRAANGHSCPDIRGVESLYQLVLEMSRPGGGKEPHIPEVVCHGTEWKAMQGRMSIRLSCRGVHNSRDPGHGRQLVHGVPYLPRFMSAERNTPQCPDTRLRADGEAVAGWTCHLVIHQRDRLVQRNGWHHTTSIYFTPLVHQRRLQRQNLA